MSRFLLKAFILSVGSASVAVAQQASSDSLKGAPVTITGCVVDGKDNSYVLTHVAEVSGPATTASATTSTANVMAGTQGAGQDAIYWLKSDSIKLVKEHVGHKVEVTGTITEESTGTVRFKQEPGKSGPDNKVEVKTDGKEVSAKTEAPIKPGAASMVKSDQTKALPVRQVKVDAVKMIAPTCP